MKKGARLKTALFFALFLAAAQAGARNVGEFGNTYKIVEPDPEEWIARKIEQTDWDNVAKQAYNRWEAKDFRNIDSVTLPKAKKTRKRYVDVTYELEFDIYGIDGEVAYPKGYKVNPIDENFQLGDTYVIIDGDDPVHVKWFMKQWKGKKNVVLLVSSGNVFKTMDAVDEDAYYLNQIIVKRLQLESVPCVFYQDGKRIVVEEYHVSENTGDDKKKAKND